MAGESLLHCLKCIIGTDHPVTQTSFAEQKALVKYSKRSTAIAEIGVFEGFNTREFAINSPDDTIIYAIDPFAKGRLGVSYLKTIATNHWKKSGITKKIRIIRGLSWDVYPTINKMFDFIFIDGDHSFEGVKRDFDLYSKKLCSKGVIAFHDARVFQGGWTNSDWGPVKLIENVIRKDQKWKIIEAVDSTVFIQRSGI